MKIMVDLRWIRNQTLDGIGRYTLSIFAEILRMKTHHIWIFLLEDEEMRDFCEGWLRNYHDSPIQATYEIYLTKTPVTSFKNQYRMPRWIKKFKPDLFYSPYYVFVNWNHPCIRVMTIHDVIPLRFPALFQQASWLFRMVMTKAHRLQKVVESADAIVTVSNSTSRDLQQLLHVRSRDITVIYPGVNMVPPALDAEAVLGRYQVPKQPFILCVSRHDPYKNLELLIDIYSELGPELKNAFPLVLVGPFHEIYTPLLQERIQAHELQERVHLVGAVQTDELPVFYQYCTVMVLLSLYEGFGLPVLEAMAYGAPVLVSSAASLPEVVGTAGILVDPYETGQILHHLEELLTHQELQKRFSMAGLIRASQFEWNQTARTLLALFERLLDEQLSE